MSLTQHRSRTGLLHAKPKTSCTRWWQLTPWTAQILRRLSVAPAMPTPAQACHASWHCARNIRNRLRSAMRLAHYAGLRELGHA